MVLTLVQSLILKNLFKIKLKDRINYLLSTVEKQGGKFHLDGRNYKNE